MPDHVAMRTAARELGLRPRVLELAVQVGEVRTVCGGAEGSRRVPRAELVRLKESAGFPAGLREKVRVVDAGKGAELLGISPARFARLARGGCFSPAHFYVNRYRTVVWLYLVRELREFAERRAELLCGSVPRGLRVLLEEGVDFRPRHWRGRRVAQLSLLAAGPWDVAAARAAVLDADALEEAVPDCAERARLAALKPELVTVRDASVAMREAAEELCVATVEDEILWHRLMLAADLEDARASESPPPVTGGVRADAGDARSESHSERDLTGRGLPRPGLKPAADPKRTAGPEPTDGPEPAAGLKPAAGSGPAPSRPRSRAASGAVAPPGQGACTGPGRDRRRAHVLSRLRGGPRRRPSWWRRGAAVSRPAF